MDEVATAQEALRQQDLVAWISGKLDLAPDAIDDCANLLAMGLDSIDIMHWLHAFRDHGYDVGMVDLYRDPTVRGWTRLLRRPAVRTSQGIADEKRVWPTADDGAPFPLTPVQHAYLVGRSPQQPLGGVGCHLYQEFDGKSIDVDALETAIRHVLLRHPMLRTAFAPDGTQRCLAGPTWSGLAIHRFEDLSDGDQQCALEYLRDRLSHRLMPVETAGCIDFQIALLGRNGYRLFSNIDLLVADAASYATILDEISALFSGADLAPVDGTYDFRSYLAQREAASAPRRQQAERYWQDRQASLPAAPDLPLARDPAAIAPVRITRRSFAFPSEIWCSFREQSSARGLTPTMVLATCYAATLSRWTGQERLLLNLTLFDRHPIHPAVSQMVADFTNVVLLDTAAQGATIAAMARGNQEAFAEAYEHHDHSGVHVVRELRRQGSHPNGAPVVFTSNLGWPLISQGAEAALGRRGWGISQTPQVWIDHMAIQHGDEVILQWDSNDALFPAALTQNLFDAYVGLVKLLAGDHAAWDAPVPDLMPAAQREVRRAVNATATPLPDGLLHADVFEQAERRPDALAIAHGDRQWSYRDLSMLARRISTALRKRGVAEGAYVGICLPRGGPQIAAVLGTLHAGATYVPIDSSQPAGRIDRICENAALSLLIVCEQDARHLDYAPTIDRLVWQSVLDQAPAGSPAPISPDRSAYVIYTSGSTGMPKGVVITHRSALNTCRDISRRYGIGEDDRLLALSALHFDLSVYDIFGVLSAGGALVLVDEAQRRDPAIWCDRIERHGITVWNTVPALFDMLLTYAEGCDLDAPARLRLVLLSGDWISLALPGRFRAFRHDGQFVAMGGATEAAIWSNALEVADVPGEWRSIPYGFPLANQRYRVVDDGGRDCPDWVAGELWIGGAGVALGYHRDTERTEAQFVETATGRWYRTGDMGRYWPDGTLEFLGRRDKQVKVGGYRVELGEIDAAFGRIDGVKTAVTLAIGDREKSLIAFAVLQPGTFELEIPANPALPESYAKLITSPHHVSTEDHSDGMIARFLLDQFARQGITFDKAPTADEVIHAYGCAPRMASVLRAWIDWLEGGNHLEVDVSGRYRVGDAAERSLNAQCADPRMAGELLAHHSTVERILRGDLPATALLEHPFWSPEHVALRLSGSREVVRIVVELHRRLGRAPRLIELGARSGVAASRLLGMLAETPVDYLGLDPSPDMVIRARDRLAQHPSAWVERWAVETIRRHAHQADIVWANNSLHRHAVPAGAIDDMMTLATPGGLLFVQEAVRLPSEALISTTLLTLDEPSSLRPPTAWCDLFNGSGASCDGVTSDGVVAAIALRTPATAIAVDEVRLRKELRQQLPDYMIPRRIEFLDSLPLTANGKIDARALTESAGASASEMRASEPPVGEAEQLLVSLWRHMLDCPAVDRNSDFFKLGGDSLLATRLIGALQSRGYRAELGDIFAYPRLAAFAGTLRPCGDAVETQLEHDSAGHHLPFPLTDLQQAYLVGREPGFALGGVGSHFFVQFEVEHFDLDRFQSAWNAMIAAHDMLRAIVNNGQQSVLSTVPLFTIQRHRVVSLGSVAAERLRDRLSREVRDPGCWPWFAVHVVQDDGDLSHVMVSLDNLFVDGMSMQMLFGELKRRYLDPDKQVCEPPITFRDYVIAQSKKEIARPALEYWRSRIPFLPPAPDLPLRCPPEAITDVRFVRMEDHLPAPDWQALRENALRHGLTPSALLLAGYAAIISAWSAKPAVTINLTLFDRRPVHPAIEDVLGDFTTLMLLAWHPATDWLGSASQMQDRLRQDLLHREVSAIRVLREMARLHDVPAVAMPVVFTSAIGYDRDEGFLSRRSWLKPIWGISQTPQTWLDNQVYEADGCLYFNWDAVEALFEPAVLRAMFDQYSTLLRRLAQDPASWTLALDDLVPPAALDRQKYSTSSSTPCLPRFTPDRAPADTAVLRDLQALVGRVIGDAIGDHQNFFDAGATSLNLVQVHAMLRQQGYRELRVTDMFVQTTPAALAKLLSSYGSSLPSVDDGSELISPALQLRERRRLNRAEIRKQTVARPSSHD